jgi:hypothetical protein
VTRRGQIAIGVAALALGLARDAAPAGQRQEPIAVIVHPSRSEHGMSAAMLRDVFLKRRKMWADGSRILVINWPARTSLREAFDKLALSMTAEQAAAYWIDQRIRGGGEPVPVSVSSPRLIGLIVSKQRGAIAYLPLSAVGKGVQVLRIEGQLPADPKYPFRIRWTH